MESNSGPSVGEESTLTIKPRGILISIGLIGFVYFFTIFSAFTTKKQTMLINKVLKR